MCVCVCVCVVGLCACRKDLTSKLPMLETRQASSDEDMLTDETDSVFDSTDAPSENNEEYAVAFELPGEDLCMSRHVDSAWLEREGGRKGCVRDMFPCFYFYSFRYFRHIIAVSNCNTYNGVRLGHFIRLDFCFFSFFFFWLFEVFLLCNR